MHDEHGAHGHLVGTESTTTAMKSIVQEVRRLSVVLLLGLRVISPYSDLLRLTTFEWSLQARVPQRFTASLGT